MIEVIDGPIPRYGSCSWSRLQETDRRRVAAVVIAAESWAYERDDLEYRMRRDVAALRSEREAVEAADFAEMAAGVRALGKHDARTPWKFADACDARGEPERAARSRAHAAWMRETA